jgi:hypothetical protein
VASARSWPHPTGESVIPIVTLLMLVLMFGAMVWALAAA